MKLLDYSPIPQEHISRCKCLQSALDEGSCQVLKLLEDTVPEEEKHAPKLFTTLEGQYRTCQYAGFLRWEGEEIAIRSRFDANGDRSWFLSYLLSRSLGVSLRVFPDMSTSSDLGGMELVLALLFLHHLEHALSLGNYRQYRTDAYNDSTPRGRLDLSRHIRINTLDNGRCAYSARSYTVDNPINRLILLAMRRLTERGGAVGELVSTVLAQRPALRSALQRLEWDLTGPGASGASQPQVLLKQAARPILHPLYGRYEPLRKTAVLILRRLGVQVFQDGGPAIAGVVIPMDRLWELFLEHAIVPPGAVAQCGVPVLLDKRQKNKSTFYPDLIFPGGDGRVVLDAKYKRDWGHAYDQGSWSTPGIRADVFQTLAYLLVCRTQATGVIFPSDTGAEAMKQLTLTAGDPRRFLVVPFPVADSTAFSCYADYCVHMDACCAALTKHLAEL